MKKLFKYTAAMAMSLMALTACQENISNEWFDPTIKPLEVTARETSFSPEASTGKIVCKTTDPITVEIEKIAPDGEIAVNSEEWLTTTVDKNVVTINVTENKAIEGRTKMLTIKSGEKKTQIAVIQQGYLFTIDGPSDLVAGDAEKTYSYGYRSSFPGEPVFSATEDWISIKRDGRDVQVTVAANTTGHIRKGSFSVTLGDMKKSVNITQFDLEKDIAGNYTMEYSTSASKTTRSAKLAGKIIVEKKKLYFQATYGAAAVPFKLPLNYSAFDMTTTLRGGTFCGGPVKNGEDDNWLYTITLSKDGYMSWTAYAYPGDPVKYMEENGKMVTVFDGYKNTGEWAGKEIVGVTIRYFNKEQFGSSTYTKISLFNIYYPRFVKVHAQ